MFLQEKASCAKETCAAALVKTMRIQSKEHDGLYRDFLIYYRNKS